MPDLNGFYQADAGGANWGYEKHNEPFTPGGRGVLVDVPTLPYQPWAVEEKRTRNLPERGYDDPTAHCFVGGVPRAIYVPSPFHILQTPTHIVILHERMSWRIIPVGNHTPLPDTMRLWMGDSVGRWDGNTLVVETRNLNGKSWLNEVGDVDQPCRHGRGAVHADGAQHGGVRGNRDRSCRLHTSVDDWHAAATRPEG